ncbi:phosphate ABC transporter membrane protein 1, PhoT family [Desulfatibacillum alkenivorans DSM 16219]|jgi:phosphate transport system permease protein|uniref:Phosphate transport system permease protein n=2 Tax=Desulfatibacillum alkenivorans TaxID=259354 RepID=A0A1M6LXT0_9BACT|nr:phosphate ABC transporter membrane protein 1, PhoT family [Desulfatibacillum alkenivorans DSM 16219]
MNMAFLNSRTREKIIKNMFFGIALACIITLGLITLFLFMEGVPIFDLVSVKDFVFGMYWYPTSDPPDFGIFPLIVGSVFVTILSATISIPLGVMSALYLAEIAKPKMREIVKPIVELIASLPSVVIGFFGMVIVAPFLQEVFDIPTGLNMFNAALMLAFMSIPTICSISEDAIYSVPNALREASLGLGATKLETIVRVILPASISGVSTAVILGMSRAIGETMVVLMVAGGAAALPQSLFDPVRPLPASIAAEMAEAPFRGDHYHALFATGVVLFIFTFFFNIIADMIAHKYKQTGDATL